MARKRKAKKTPPWGRPQEDLEAELGLNQFAPDVPLGNTDPTVVQGVIEGGMPNNSRMARGSLITQRGKRT